jgi:amidase
MGGVLMDRRQVLRGGLAACGLGLMPAGLRASGVTDRVGPAPQLPFATALQAAEAIRRRRISSRELTQLALERIDRYNPALNAIVNVLREEALAAARGADEALAHGRARGAFHGVPITLKESFEIRGVPATVGLEELRTHVPAEDSDAVARLRAAGAIILGNTNVPVRLADWQSANPIYGRSNNPWDLSRTPGGSSGGSAAALASGLGYLSMGSDIGGSIRVPAHFCGIYGHKPTIGVVSRAGHIPPMPALRPQPANDLAVVGPMARSAPDLAAAMQVVGGPGAEDAVAYRWTMPPARRNRLGSYRFGYVLDDPFCPVVPAVKDRLARAIDALGKAGARLNEGWPPEVEAETQFRTYSYLLWEAMTPPMEADELESLRLAAVRNDRSLETLRAHSLADPYSAVTAVRAARLRHRAVWQRFFRDHDAFLMPTAFTPAFPHDDRPIAARVLATPTGDRPYNDLLFWITVPTLTGLPATIAPVGLTSEGLPVGVQIVGPYLEDATPIDVATRLADVVGGFQPPPGY